MMSEAEGGGNRSSSAGSGIIEMNISLQVPDCLAMPAAVLSPKLLLAARWYHFIGFSLNNVQFLAQSFLQPSICGQQRDLQGWLRGRRTSPPGWQVSRGICNTPHSPASLLPWLHQGLLAPFDPLERPTFRAILPCWSLLWFLGFSAWENY